MINKNLCAIALLILSVSAQAKDASVRKADGSTAKYKLMPVHLDPSHAKLVESRKEYSMRDVPTAYTIPKTQLPAMRDQGQRGTCVYFATVGMMETYLINNDPANAKTKVSEQCLVGLRNWEADNKSYTGDDRPTDYRPDPDGDYLDLVAKTASYYGVPAEGKYPQAKCKYDLNGDSKATSLDQYNSIFAQGLSPAFGKGHAFEVDKAPTVEKIKELISKNVPVEIATLVYQDHFTTSNWDYNGMTDTQAKLAGGHAIILVGYRSTKNSTKFIFKNSWGNWGAGGYGTITDRLLRHSWKSDAEYDIMVSYHD